MRVKTCALKAATLVVAYAGSSAAYAGPDARGVWLNDTGRGAVEIKDCGSKLCGHVVWTRDASDVSRGCGKQMIGDVAPSGGGVWDGGWVYSPDKKRRYDVELKPLSNGTLRVVGFAGTRFFSKTMIWTKAPANLQRCDTPAVEANAPPVLVKSETAAVKPTEVATPNVKAATAPPVAVKPTASGALQALAAAEAGKALAQPAPAPQPVAPSKAPTVAASEPPAPTQGPEAEAPAAKAGVSEALEALADEPISAEDLVEKLDGKEFGNGYGLKKVKGGRCRVKLPFVTLTVDCER